MCANGYRIPHMQYAAAYVDFHAEFYIINRSIKILEKKKII
jgi:hypothetical protein